MGSRSHPHRVLCVCVCVSRCLWVCVIEADSLQLRVITVGYFRSCHAVSLFRSLQCLPCSGQRFRSVPVPGSVIPEPCCFPGLRTPETRLPIASLRYPPLPTESSTVVFSHGLLCNKPSIFRNWILPSSLWQKDLTNLHGFSGDSWYAGTVSRQQRSYGSPGGEYVEHRTSCAGVSSAGIRAHNPGTIIKITRCATHTAKFFHPREQQPSART